MERHDIAKCLVDIRTSIDIIEEYLVRIMGTRRDFNLYMQDRLLRNGVERQLEIIGEATKRIMQSEPTFELTNARKIVDTRNRRQAERRACLHELARGAKEETAA